MASIATPRIASDLVLQSVAGLRPFRPAGFRVELEQYDNRVVVHNYGHGGSGVTLAPGTASLAADAGAATEYGRAAVLGAGAVGLCTARELQRRGIRVTVYTAARSPATTSNIAGALWGAFTIVDPGYATPAFRERLAAVARSSHAAFASLSPQRYGIRTVPLYLVGAAAELPWEMALTPELFPVTRLQRGEHPFAAPAALRTTTLMIEPARFLAALEEDVLTAGGAILARELTSLDDVLALGEPLIVNCLGLAAGKMFGDPSIEPIKGELALLASQPGMDYAVISLDEDAYILPRDRTLLVGGSRVRGEMSPEPRAAEIESILARARRLFR